MEWYLGTLATDDRIRDVHFTEDSLSVDLMDRRTISVPLVWYPKLSNVTTREQLNNWKQCGSGYGIHWPDIDEDISTVGILNG